MKGLGLSLHSLQLLCFDSIYSPPGPYAAFKPCFLTVTFVIHMVDFKVCFFHSNPSIRMMNFKLCFLTVTIMLSEGLIVTPMDNQGA